MISTERAKRVLADMRGGPITDLSPARSETIVATALRDAREHGAAIAVTVIAQALKAEPAFARLLLISVTRALEFDEESSCEPDLNPDDCTPSLDHGQAPDRGEGP